MPVSERSRPTIERCILLLCDSWSSIQDGIAGANRSLALSLTRYKGIKVVSTIFTSLDKLSAADKKEADENNVTFVTPDPNSGDPSDLYTKVNEDPSSVFTSLIDQVPYVTHIVGHSPITAEAAIKLKESLYTKAKVILFYHVIPHDVEWMTDSLPYALPTDTEQVQLAEKADVVYSVSEKLHWFYTAKFRNRATTEVDHRLFLPQCAQQVFNIARQPADKSTPKILALSGGSVQDSWQGLDIVSCAVNKVAAATEGPVPQLTIGGVLPNEVQQMQDDVKDWITESSLNVDVKSYGTTEDLFKDLSDFSLCVVPSRAEPYGYRGLFALSAGIPTLISEDSALAPIIRRLTSEPEYFLVPVTPTASAVRQDGSVWRDRIMAILQDPETAHKRASQLKMALRRDEPTKESHDNIICYTLGGIRVCHEASHIDFIYRRDEDKELPVLRSFNKFLMATIKQCWRLKHHPLTTDGDLFQILPGVELPIPELMKRVTDHVEDRDRRIVGVDEDSGSFIVYCPTPDALSDLWAMCDRINGTLVETLLSGEENEILPKFKLKKAEIRTVIQGPEFLKYKWDLLSNASQ